MTVKISLAVHSLFPFVITSQLHLLGPVRLGLGGAWLGTHSEPALEPGVGAGEGPVEGGSDGGQEGKSRPGEDGEGKARVDVGRGVFF